MSSISNSSSFQSSFTGAASASEPTGNKVGKRKRSTPVDSLSSSEDSVLPQQRQKVERDDIELLLNLSTERQQTQPTLAPTPTPTQTVTPPVGLGGSNSGFVPQYPIPFGMGMPFFNPFLFPMAPVYNPFYFPPVFNSYYINGGINSFSFGPSAVNSNSSSSFSGSSSSSSASALPMATQSDSSSSSSAISITYDKRRSKRIEPFEDMKKVIELFGKLNNPTEKDIDQLAENCLNYYHKNEQQRAVFENLQACAEVLIEEIKEKKRFERELTPSELEVIEKAIGKKYEKESIKYLHAYVKIARQNKGVFIKWFNELHTDSGAEQSKTSPLVALYPLPNAQSFPTQDPPADSSCIVEPSESSSSIVESSSSDISIPKTASMVKRSAKTVESFENMKKVIEEFGKLKNPTTKAINQIAERCLNYRATRDKRRFAFTHLRACAEILNKENEEKKRLGRELTSAELKNIQKGIDISKRVSTKFLNQYVKIARQYEAVFVKWRNKPILSSKSIKQTSDIEPEVELNIGPVVEINIEPSQLIPSYPSTRVVRFERFKGIIDDFGKLKNPTKKDINQIAERYLKRKDLRERHAIAKDTLLAIGAILETERREERDLGRELTCGERRTLLDDACGMSKFMNRLSSSALPKYLEMARPYEQAFVDWYNKQNG